VPTSDAGPRPRKRKRPRCQRARLTAGLLLSQDESRPRGENAAAWRELAVISLRVWLAEDSERGRSRENYRVWSSDSGWANPNVFSAHGGLPALKREAANANARDRRKHGNAVPDSVLQRGIELQAELCRGVAGEAAEAASFGDMLRAVLDGNHAVGQPPRQ
jgi:erythromycin esterase-like protein